MRKRLGLGYILKYIYAYICTLYVYTISLYKSYAMLQYIYLKHRRYMAEIRRKTSINKSKHFIFVSFVLTSVWWNCDNPTDNGSLSMYNKKKVLKIYIVILYVKFCTRAPWPDTRPARPPPTSPGHTRCTSGPPGSDPQSPWRGSETYPPARRGYWLKNNYLL